MSPAGGAVAVAAPQEDADEVNSDGPASEALLSHPEAPLPSQEMLMN